MKDVVKKHKDNCIQFFLSQEVSFFKKCSIFILLLVIILFPFFTTKAKANTTVTLDNTSSGSISWNHTTGNHPNTILLVGVTQDIPGISVTYAGHALTPLRVISYFASFTVGMWYLKNPPVGTYQVRVNSADGDVSGGAATFYNVGLSSNTFGNVNTTATFGGSPNVSVNATTSQLVVDTTGWLAGNGGSSPGNGQSMLWSQGFFGTPNIANGASNKTGIGGNTPMTWNGTGGNVWAEVVVALNGVAAPTPTPTPTVTPTPTPTPTPIPPASISGNIYVDKNNDQHFDAGDTLYTGGTSSITFTGPVSKTVT